MPIDYKKYGPNWKILRYKILDRTQDKCELCSVSIKEPHPITGSKVVLTVHHINFNIQDNRDYNLIALCQRCHLKLDMPNKVDKRKGKFNFLNDEKRNRIHKITDRLNVIFIGEAANEEKRCDVFKIVTKDKHTVRKQGEYKSDI